MKEKESNLQDTILLLLIVFIIFAIANFCMGCNTTQGSSGHMGQQGIQGPSGAQGATGTQGSQGAQGQAGSNGLDGSNGTNGVNGIDATPTTIIQFCPGITPSYPSTFPEVGICLSNQLYAVYSANGGFLVLVTPGTYSSNGLNATCTFTVGPSCQISN